MLKLGRTDEILFDTGTYPMWDQLKSCINTLGIVGIQPRDIITIANSLLKLPTVEHAVGIRDILVDQVRTDPDCHVTCRMNEFKEEYDRIVMIMALLTSVKGLTLGQQVLITRELPSDSVEVTVDGEIIECQAEAGFLENSAPPQVRATLRHCQSLAGLYSSLDPEGLWGRGLGREAFRAAVKVAVCQRRVSQGSADSDIETLAWSVGPEFLETCEDLGFGDDQARLGTLLRACTETILGEKPGATHRLRTGRGGNDPQRMRGDDGAWRRDVDYTDHLHYWATTNGPEFASVVVHDDFTIPE